MAKYCVENLLQQHGETLGLKCVVGHAGMTRRICVPEAHRPGLSLANFLNAHAPKRILIFGKVEMLYLNLLETQERVRRLEAILLDETPAVMVARNYQPPKELKLLCRQKGIPLFRSTMTTMNLISKLTLLLTEEFAPGLHVHGTLVEVFGVGVLIQGSSSVGKSEAGLGLIERGHRLISDDVVRVRKREGTYLEGCGVDITRHHMEIRGIGIINVAHLYGVVCVRDKKSVDLVVMLENWDENHFYDRVGLEENTCEMLGVRVPCHMLPVKPGRDVVLLLETIALNHRLKKMGYNSARELSAKLCDAMVRKRKRPSRKTSLTGEL
jgi:HPr kinase/phosphorylase